MHLTLKALEPSSRLILSDDDLPALPPPPLTHTAARWYFKNITQIMILCCLDPLDGFSMRVGKVQMRTENACGQREAFLKNRGQGREGSRQSDVRMQRPRKDSSLASVGSRRGSGEWKTQARARGHGPARASLRTWRPRRVFSREKTSSDFGVKTYFVAPKYLSMK